MAYQDIILPQFNYMGKTVSVTVRADSSLSLTAPTKNTITSIGDLIERIDVVAGTYELQNVELAIVDTYEHETEGFWRRVFAGAEVPQVWIYLNEGAGDTIYIIGSATVNLGKWEDKYTSSNEHAYVRHATITLADILVSFKNVDISDVAAECLNHKVIDNLFSTKPFVSSFDYSGAGTARVGYRIAACSANDEDIWGDEVTTDYAPNGWGTVTLHWAAIPGADHYVVYRTTDTISQSTGRLAEVPAYTYPTYVDSGATPQASTQKSRTYVSLQDIFASFIAVAFSQTFARANAVMTEAINNFRFSSVNVTSTNVRGLYVPTDTMTASSELYWGDRYASAWDLFFALCKNFALIPRHFYDLTVIPHLHKVEFVTRENAYTTTISFQNALELDHSPDNTQKATTVECHRANGSNKYPVGIPIDSASYDLSVECEYVATIVTSGVNQRAGAPVYFGNYTIPKLYVSMVSGFSSGIAYVNNGDTFEQIKYTGVGTEAGKAFLLNVTSSKSFISAGDVYPGDPEVKNGERLYTYNGSSCKPVISMSYWDAAANALVPQASGDLLLASLRNYLYARLSTRKQRVRKKYGRCAATENGVVSHTNVRVCKRMAFFNGIATLTHYASEVRKSLMENTCEIEWIQE